MGGGGGRRDEEKPAKGGDGGRIDDKKPAKKTERPFTNCYIRSSSIDASLPSGRAAADDEVPSRDRHR